MVDISKMDAELPKEVAEEAEAEEEKAAADEADADEQGAADADAGAGAGDDADADADNDADAEDAEDELPKEDKYVYIIDDIEETILAANYKRIAKAKQDQES